MLDKPVGPGSTDAVSAVKRALRAGGYPKMKVGHGGTLDPLASGVLPVALGEATKLAGRLLASDQQYQFTVQFGRETDTLDREGQVVAASNEQPGFGALETVLKQRFTGEIDQVPPAYSALKIDGARAYDLARAGAAVSLPTRRVTVYCWRCLAEGFAGGSDGSEQFATLEVGVSKGTYIRSLARDIARALGTVGHVTMLRRTGAGPFDLSSAITLDKLAELGQARALEHHLLPLRAGLDDIPALPLTPDQAGALRQGRVLAGIAADDGQAFATCQDAPVALVEVRGGEVRVVRGFNL